MIEILGQLEEYFNNTEPESECDFATCKSKNDKYEIWSVSEFVFDKLKSYTGKEWKEHYPKSWWRCSTGSSLDSLFK